MLDPIHSEIWEEIVNVHDIGLKLPQFLERAYTSSGRDCQCRLHEFLSTIASLVRLERNYLYRIAVFAECLALSIYCNVLSTLGAICVVTMNQCYAHPTPRLNDSLCSLVKPTD